MVKPGTHIISQSALSCFPLLPPLCGIHKLPSFPLTLCIPVEYSLGEVFFWSKYFKYSTPGMYTLIGNIGLKASDLAMLRTESRCGTSLDIIFHIFFIVTAALLDFSLWICSFALLTGISDIGLFRLWLPWPSGGTHGWLVLFLWFCFGAMPFDDLRHSREGLGPVSLRFYKK